MNNHNFMWVYNLDFTCEEAALAAVGLYYESLDEAEEQEPERKVQIAKAKAIKKALHNELEIYINTARGTVLETVRLEEYSGYGGFGDSSWRTLAPETTISRESLIEWLDDRGEKSSVFHSTDSSSEIDEVTDTPPQLPGDLAAVEQLLNGTHQNQHHELAELLKTWLEGSVVAEEPINPMTENNYLRVISSLSGALIGGLTDVPHTDANALEAVFAKKGLDSPIGKQTMAKYLKAAQDI